MRVIREHSLLSRTVWVFGTRDYYGQLILSLDRTVAEARPTTRHKWRPEVVWDRLRSRTGKPAPVPNDVVREALAQVRIHVVLDGKTVVMRATEWFAEEVQP